MASVVVKKELDSYEQSLVMKEKLREFLTDTERFPKALVFLSRNMRMVQGMKLLLTCSSKRWLTSVVYCLEVTTKRSSPL